MKLCQDCKHAHWDNITGVEFAMCDVAKSPVDGSPNSYCSIMRKYECGNDAKFFEPRPPNPTSIFNKFIRWLLMGKGVVVLVVLFMSCGTPVPKENRFVVSKIETSGCDCAYNLRGYSLEDCIYMPCGLFTVGDTIMFVKYSSETAPVPEPIADTATGTWGEKPRGSW